MLLCYCCPLLIVRLSNPNQYRGIATSICELMLGLESVAAPQISRCRTTPQRNTTQNTPNLCFSSLALFYVNQKHILFGFPCAATLYSWFT